MHTDNIKKQDLEIVKQLKSHLLLVFFNDIDRMLLIGSRANGTSKRESDYDIVIVLNKKNYDWQYKNKIIDTIYDFELTHNIMVDLHIISNEELNKGQRGIQPFFRTALIKGIVI